MLHFMSLLPKLMNQQVDEDLRLREQSILVGMTGVTDGIYNHATSNLAIYSHETSQDKLSEAYYRQSIIVIQVHDKLHEKKFIFTC